MAQGAALSEAQKDAITLVEASEAPAVKVAVTDIDGILRGKYISKAKFLSALKGGFGFCDVIFGWDSADQLYDNVTYTGWHTGYPDAQARLIPESARKLPLEDDTPFFLAEFVGSAEAVCPRGVLRRVIEKASDMGFVVCGGFEYEFFVFEETPDSVTEKGYQNLKPLTPGSFGYSMIRNSVYAGLYDEFLRMAQDMRFDIEGFHTETGPGVLEAALAVSQGTDIADRGSLFKTFTKVLAQKNGLMATFMAKWNNDVPGQSGHLHISLLDKESGKNVFYDDGAAHNMSALQTAFVGGQQQLMPELCAMIAPTINSYSRLVPGYWAPTHATWGIENRTCALRVIGGGEKSQRTEYRVGAADGNPYLVLAAALGSGLYGIERDLQPTAPVEGNAYENTRGAKPLSPTLWHAAQELAASAAAQSLFGETFTHHFAKTREWEEREFRKHVTDWELRRYFEII